MSLKWNLLVLISSGYKCKTKEFNKFAIFTLLFLSQLFFQGVCKVHLKTKVLTPFCHKLKVVNYFYKKVASKMFRMVLNT